MLLLTESSEISRLHTDDDMVILVEEISTAYKNHTLQLSVHTVSTALPLSERQPTTPVAPHQSKIYAQETLCLFHHALRECGLAKQVESLHAQKESAAEESIVCALHGMQNGWTFIYCNLRIK